jgi:hypothetical protein
MNPRASLPADWEALAAEPYESGVWTGPERDARRGRTSQRLLYSFENGDAGDDVLNPSGKRVAVTISSDHAVTHGKSAARVVAPKGRAYSELAFGAREIKDWTDYDYLAVDLYNPEDHSHSIQFELWDQETDDYYTRYTVGTRTRKGIQTLLFPIHHAKRNGKQGMTWNELRPEDKIDMGRLTLAKLFFKTGKERGAVFWIDNIRLLQEDAAVPKMAVELPGAVTAAYDFGAPGTTVRGFTPVSHFDRYEGRHGFTGRVALEDGGRGWPDLLSGTFVRPTGSGLLQFSATIAKGRYQVWLCGGRIINHRNRDTRYLLKVNGETIYEDDPTPEVFDGEKYLHRFMWTQYSARPHALWLDYIQPMYPVFKRRIRVTDGLLKIDARNFFISAIVVMPEKADADFRRMSARLLQRRLRSFEHATTPPDPQARPAWAGSADFTLYVPLPDSEIGPRARPNEAERVAPRMRATGARGQNAFMRLALLPHTDIGRCSFRLSDLRGAGGRRIPTEAITGRIANWRYGEQYTSEMALLPTLSLWGEPGITQCLWLWVKIPDDAVAGVYTGIVSFDHERKPEPGGAVIPNPPAVPVEIEVYPFRLQDKLPLALGMYYAGRRYPRPPADDARPAMRAQLRWMRSLGFTASSIPAPIQLTGMDTRTGKTQMRFDPAPFQIAMEEGLGQLPEQTFLVSQLGLARGLARKLPGIRGAAVEHDPGLELRQAGFKNLWSHALGQYKAFLDSHSIPYAMEIVDEPREVPNPWNRNLADTITYGKWLGDLKFNRFVTLMADYNDGKDYSRVVEHTDIVSIHGHKGAPRVFGKALVLGRRTWFYNIGMSRWDWGFYPWAYDATGRFEWHWCFVDGWQVARGDYPGREWHNPFTPMEAPAPNAPISIENPGGFLYTSSLLTASEGIADFAYLATLQRLIVEHTGDPDRQEALEAARGLLKALRTEIRAGKPVDMDRRRRDLAERIAALQ